MAACITYGSCRFLPDGSLVPACAAPGIKVTATGPVLMVTRPLPRVLMLHTGGTLGMDPMVRSRAKTAPETQPGDRVCLQQAIV